MIFFPQDPLKRMRSRKLLEMILAHEGLGLLFWRDVQVCPEILSEKARSSMPAITQCFIRRPVKTARGLDFDRKLYLARREYEHSVSGTYVVSMSSRTIVCKGLFLVWQLRKFYPDLQDTDFTSALALVHSRFSTNTTPSWKRAHPNRIILHNGEINTIRGNINRMLAREETMASPVLGDEIARAYPVVETDGSDSSMLDNTLEFLMYSGIELPKAVMLCIPETWGRDKNMSREKRDMFHYYASMMEPWDGPAAILFSDGEQAGAVLDRNGLRPARYLVTNDGYLILASKVGALPIPPERIVRKSRLQPGKMLLVDTRTGTVLEDREFKHRYAAEHPYGEWLDQELLQLADIPIPNRKAPEYTALERNRLYKAFGYTYDEIHSAILPMAKNGAEPTASMGADIPLAVLSEKHQPLFYYFTCPMGIATQRPELRKNFCGKPDYLVNFMEFVAQELRMIMAKLGVRTVDELVGHTEYLRILPHQITQRAAMVDVSGILARCSEENCHYDPAQHFDFKLDATLDKQVLLPLLPKKGKAAAPKCCNVDISCSDRAFGTLFCAEITRRWGSALEDDTYQIHCRGGAGQSFGAFLPKGVTLTLEGDSNDYFGKGLSGGRLVVFADRASTFEAAENVIIGNVALYGATSGSAFISGIADERFCVRNSGADVVVEGVGDHGCEYMTGGTVVVLGQTGRNFAAGMRAASPMCWIRSISSICVSTRSLSPLRRSCRSRTFPVSANFCGVMSRLAARKRAARSSNTLTSGSRISRRSFLMTTVICCS